jgi:hypothetical protein
VISLFFCIELDTGDNHPLSSKDESGVETSFSLAFSLFSFHLGVNECISKTSNLSADRNESMMRNETRIIGVQAGQVQTEMAMYTPNPPKPPKERKRKAKEASAQVGSRSNLFAKEKQEGDGSQQ